MGKIQNFTKNTNTIKFFIIQLISSVLTLCILIYDKKIGSVDYLSGYYFILLIYQVTGAFVTVFFGYSVYFSHIKYKTKWINKNIEIIIILSLIILNIFVKNNILIIISGFITSIYILYCIFSKKAELAIILAFFPSILYSICVLTTGYNQNAIISISSLILCIFAQILYFKNPILLLSITNINKININFAIYMALIFSFTNLYSPISFTDNGKIYIIFDKIILFISTIILNYFTFISFWNKKLSNFIKYEFFVFILLALSLFIIGHMFFELEYIAVGIIINAALLTILTYYLRWTQNNQIILVKMKKEYVYVGVLIFIVSFYINKFISIFSFSLPIIYSILICIKLQHANRK